MDKIVTMILLGAFGAMLQNVPLYQWILKKTGLERKPFACALCLTFWMSLGYCLASFSILDSIFIASGAGILAETLDRHLNNL